MLSSSTLRARVRRVSGASAWPDAPWGGLDGLARGARLQRPQLDGAARIIEHRDGALTADAATLPDWWAHLGAGDLLECAFDEPAPLLAARVLTGTPGDAPLPPLELRLATTRGTNALLERRGAPTALFVTRGFADVLAIGDQRRDDLFALAVRPRDVLAESVVEVDERVGSDGRVVEPLDARSDASWLAEARELLERGVRCAAVAFLHSYAAPAHERTVAALLRQAGFEHVVCSSAVPLAGFLARAETAVLEAYLGPVLTAYLDRIRSSGPLRVLTSAGGLVSAERFRPRDGLLSGPAGGVAGFARAAHGAGFRKAIGIDMGGTSTDVSRVDDGFDYRFAHEVGGVRVLAPALAIETIAAGGGSRCDFARGRLTVGPESEGATPGPACYGAGGRLTLTDVNLLCGVLDPSAFAVSIVPGDAQARLDELLAQIGAQEAGGPRPEEVLEGLRTIAEARMAEAIERVSVRAGYDPADHVLVAFGGAAAQHACAVADRLGMTTILVPADASILSAVGVAGAAIEHVAQRQLDRTDRVDDPAAMRALFADLDREACARVRDDAGGAGQVVRRILAVRSPGQESAVDLDWVDGLDVEEAFSRQYESVFGHRAPGGVEGVAGRAVVRGDVDTGTGTGTGTGTDTDTGTDTGGGTACVLIGGAWMEVPVCRRRDVSGDAEVPGPLLVRDDGTTLLVRPEFAVRRLVTGDLRLDRRVSARSSDVAAGIVSRELTVGRLASIAEEMGLRLERTAVSTNVRDRLDFSCALLDADGRMVVNAPHVPVHLGAIGACVRALIDEIAFRPGDLVVTNHPAYGGSHLPDVTVVAPVFSAGCRIGFVASRAHHADIGGTRPGSMPPDARTLAEEGVVIPPTLLRRGGDERFDAVAAMLRSSPYPCRCVRDVIADLRAQVAAVTHGVRGLEGLAADDGGERLAGTMAFMLSASCRLLTERLVALGPFDRSARDSMDDGWPLAVRIVSDGSRLRVDFAGSGGVHPGNLNATAAIVSSAVTYVLRLLVGDGGPAGLFNEGLLSAASIDLPVGFLSPPFDAEPARCPAVVGGNVETSQRIVDVCLAALGLAAASQGTMNNVLFGSSDFAYYETICGGTGAGPGFDGVGPVHSHMTNTRITDAEILERRYPVRLERFARRRGTGGQGRWRGGDGARRVYHFLAPMVVSVLAQRRLVPPPGAAGGSAGVRGAHWIDRADGTRLALAPSDGATVAAGDRLVIETPGGGGWGSELDRGARPL